MTMQDQTGSVWDPFDGRVAFQREAVAPPGRGLQVPGWIRTVLGLMAIASAAFIVAGFFSRTMGFVGVGLIVVSVGGLMLVDFLGKAKDARDYRLFRVAERNGWAFRRVAESFSTGQGGRKTTVADPLFRRLAERAPELILARPGQLIPFVMMAAYWGKTAEGSPFWMGLGEYEADATLGTESFRRDAFANRSLRGKLYTMCVAFDLARDTGIRARLLAEALPGEGWRDLKTESVDFNQAFHLTISKDMTGGDGELALLRTLTPATQATLIDLSGRYKLQMIIDGPTLFMAGQDRIMSEDPDVLAAHLAGLVRAFATAAIALKPYAE